MKGRRKLEQILEEASRIGYYTKQMRNGNLDIKIDPGEYVFLKDLAADINQIVSTFNTYINEMTRVLSHLSAGNMAVAFSEDVIYRGDFLPIKNALYKIRHSLNCSFEEILKLSGELDAMSQQVENSSSFLATNTTEQAALIADLTSTIYDITDKTVTNAANAKTAAKNLETIIRETEVGRSHMEDLLLSADRVKSSMDDISHIIELIKGFADRTRWLALNATIEAARAGKHGQGFSVVAGEISKLAQKSSEAVKQTTQLINNSRTAVEESAQITAKTVESFSNINDSIEGVTGLCQEIAELSNLQAESLKETSLIITNISGAVQSNAACAQKNSSEAMNMSNISAHLKKVLERFRLMGQEKVPVTDQKTVEKLARELTGKLIAKLFNATTTQAIDKVLATEIQNHENVECLYVIDGEGRQLSHTILNPKIMVDRDDNFKPALPGEDYSAKKYYRQAMHNKQQLYISPEYISKATGNLCQTTAYAYQGADRKYYVLCIDLLCRF